MTLCSPAWPDVRGARHRRRTLLALACMGIALAARPVSAVGLGAVTQQSALGQSLRVVVPLTLGEGEAIAPECFKIVGAASDADGVPQVLFGRVSVERSAAGSALVVTSGRPVNEPVVRLTLQAGCETAMRREYTLFLDPPAIEVPIVAAAEPAPREVAAVPAPSPVAREARRPPRPPARTTTRAATRQAPSAGAGEGAAAARKPAPTKGRAVAKAAPPPRPPPVAADRPRLAVSSGAPGAATEADREKARQEQAAAIEAETQVLRQRIVELTALVERMQEELRAQERAEQAAKSAAPAEPAASAPKESSAAPAAAAPPPQAKAPPAAKSAPVPDSDWWDDNATLIGVLIGLPFVLAAFLLWRRRRATEDEQWRAARIPAARGAQSVRGPTSVLRNPVAGLASPRTEAASTITHSEPADSAPPDVAVDAMAVSELSHATEEAGVFLAFGQRERAIEVLREHIRQLPRAMPAAWLMLLDLYHAEGNRPEFRKLAEDFHLHFNVQAPLWEAFGVEPTPADGIESFPHVQKQVVELWRKPGCRAYLDRLLHDNREGRRNGFPLSAYADILLLLQVLDAPEAIDIDRDLADSGRLDHAPKAAAAAPASRHRTPVPPAPAQQPIRFDLDPPSFGGTRKP